MLCKIFYKLYLRSQLIYVMLNKTWKINVKSVLGRCLMLLAYFILHLIQSLAGSFCFYQNAQVPYNNIIAFVYINNVNSRFFCILSHFNKDEFNKDGRRLYNLSAVFVYKIKCHLFYFDITTHIQTIGQYYKKRPLSI